MRCYLFDTDAVSFIYKGDTRGRRYKTYLSGSLSSISFMTLAELDLWAESHNWGHKKREDFALFLRQFAVIESSRDLCRMWASVTEEVRRQGRKIQPGDAWIAATALLYNLPLVTHNADDFVGIAGLTVISEPDK